MLARSLVLVFSLKFLARSSFILTQVLFLCLEVSCRMKLEENWVVKIPIFMGELFLRMFPPLLLDAMVVDFDLYLFISTQPMLPTLPTLCYLFLVSKILGLGGVPNLSL